MLQIRKVTKCLYYRCMTERALSLAWPQNFSFLGAARVFGIAALVGTMLSLPLTNIFVTLALLCWVFAGCKPGQTWQIDLKNPAVSGALLLLAWMLLSLLWSHASFQNTFMGIWKYRKLAYVPLMVFLFADATWRDRAIKAWLAAAVVLMLYALIHILPDPIGDGHMGVHPALPLSTYSYITLGFVLIPALTLGLAWMMRAKAMLDKSLGALVALLTVAFVVLAQQGRTTYVTLTALVIFFILTQLKSTKKWLAMAVLLIAAVSVGTLSTKLQMRVAEVVADSQVALTTETIASSGLRIGFWRTTLDIVKHNPVLGTGMGTWADEYRKYVLSTPNTPKIATSGGNPHQEYLLIASQLGLIGLALFVSWLVRCVINSKRLAKNERLAAQSLLVAFIVGCFFNATLFDSATGHFFCIGLGILFAGYRDQVEIEVEVKDKDKN
jgi:O-antigen ligase